MTTISTKTYQVTVIERMLAFYEVEAENARDAAENWQDGEFHDRDDEALESEGPTSVREQQPDGSWRMVPASEWEDEPPVAGSATKPYSVLLLYPDYANDSGSETYYAFVEASDPLDAVAVAQRQAGAASDGVGFDDPDDFAPLLVTEGHHRSQPLYGK